MTVNFIPGRTPSRGVRGCLLLLVALSVCVLGAPGQAAAATGPIATGLGETGPTRGITGFRVRFTRALDPAEARSIGNYAFVGIGANGARTQIPLRSASYKRGARSVRVRTVSPLDQGVFRRLSIRLKGRRGGLSDARGRLLDGDRNGRAGGNAVFVFRVFRSTSVTFSEPDGDRATIRIRRGGLLDGIVPIRGPETQHTQFWILDPIALRSTLSGTVRPRGDGLVVIAEISGLRGVITEALDLNDLIRVNTKTQGSNATGIG